MLQFPDNADLAFFLFLYWYVVTFLAIPETGVCLNKKKVYEGLIIERLENMILLIFLKMPAESVSFLASVIILKD